MWTERPRTKSVCTFLFLMMWTFIVIAQAHNIVASTTNNSNTPVSDNYNHDNDNVNNISNNNNNINNSNSELEYFFESDIKISTMVFHRLLVTKYFQKSRNVDSVSRHLPFQVRLPHEAYVTDFQLSLRRTHRSRLVDRLETKHFKVSSVSHLTRSRAKGCDEFNFRFKVLAGETVEMTLTYEQLLERSEGRYEIEPYRDLCRQEIDRKYAHEDASRYRHHHGNHHYRHNKIDQFKVDVVVKETSNVNKLVTHPKDTSPIKVQSIIAGLSDMIPRSASVGDDSGKIPVMLKRRLPDEVHYQFLYKEKYQEMYEGHASPPSSSSSPPPSSSSSLSSSSKPLNWFIPREVRVSYDVQRDNLGEVQTRGSHFVYFFAPTHNKFNQLDRDVVFLVDSSPEDVQEVHDALKKVLQSKLSVRDKFNILHFVPTVADEGSNLGRNIRRVVIGMAAGSDKNIKTAAELLDDLTGFQLTSALKHHEGSPYAEMREGILQSLDLLNRQKESDPYDTRLSLLFYITSTRANMFHLSKVEQEKILLSVEKGNRANAVIIPIILARGQSAKSESNFDHLHFLDVLSRLSNGSTFVHDQDSTDFESFLFRVLESTSKVLLKDLTLKAHSEKSSYGRSTNGQNESFALQITTSHYPHFKEGTELIAAGHIYNTLHGVRRLKVNSDQKSVSQHKKANFKLSVTGIGNNGFVSFDTDIAFRKSRRGYSHEEIDEEFNDDDLEQLRIRLKKFNHLERIKIHLQLKELQQMIFLKKGRNGEEAKKLQIAYREMAAQHNLLTPGKCLLLDKSLGRDSAICAIDENDSSAHGVKLMTMDEPLKSFADNDPHFVVRVDGLTEHVCFDVLGRAGKVLQLLHDRSRDITVNALIVEPRDASNGNHTYIGRISFITSEGRCLVVDTRWISFNGSRHAWNSNVTIELSGNSNTKIGLLSRRVVRIEHQTLTLRVMKHHVETAYDERFHYLGFYIDNEDQLSHRASGLIDKYIELHKIYHRCQKKADDYSQKVSLRKIRAFNHRRQFSWMTGHMESSSLKVKQSGSEDSISLRSRLIFKTDSSNRSAVAHLSYRRDMESRARMPCWHVGSEGRDVAGRVDRFLVPTLCHRGPAVRSAG